MHGAGPEEKALLRVFHGEVSSLPSLDVSGPLHSSGCRSRTRAGAGRSVVSAAPGAGVGVGCLSHSQVRLGSVPSQLSTSTGASGLRKNLVPPAFLRGRFLCPSDLKAAQAWAATPCWTEICQLSWSPKASAFRQMKAWKVLWLNRKKAAYITRPGETGRKAPPAALFRGEEKPALVERRLPWGAGGGAGWARARGVWT